MMRAEIALPLGIALVHHPVRNKRGETIGSAVTNLDLHDIARAARTYGVDRYFVTTPYADQQALVAEIVGHWRDGYGATYNPARKEALEIIRVVASLEEAIEAMQTRHGQRPLIVATSAQEQGRSIAFDDLQQMVAAGKPVLLVFGTAHGLAPEVIDTVDAVLPPLKGRTAYNHLSVRSAVAIILDRLLGL